jgi:hypothetical protein
MYVIATHLGPLDEHGYYRYSSSHLYDVATKAELIELAGRHDRVSRVTAATAHRWVKDGNIHSTGLYVDQGRIRKARGE